MIRYKAVVVCDKCKCMRQIDWSTEAEMRRKKLHFCPSCLRQGITLPDLAMISIDKHYTEYKWGAK
jgi:hypothetical protein